MEISQRVRAILSFVEAVDGGSFAAASRALGISAAAVSKNVAGLEQALGVRLMNRTTRTLSLTDEGTLFLKQARIALEALDAAVDVLAEQRVETSGHVRISSSAAFGRDHLMPVLPGLQTRYPALSVEVDFDDRIIDLVRDGYDLALRGGHIADSALVPALCVSSIWCWWPRRIIWSDRGSLELPRIWRCIGLSCGAFWPEESHLGVSGEVMVASSPRI